MMGRMDIKVKKGTTIIVEYSDGSTVTWSPVSDIDIDHLHDTVGRLEMMEPSLRTDHQDGSE